MCGVVAVFRFIIRSAFHLSAQNLFYKAADNFISSEMFAIWLEIHKVLVHDSNSILKRLQSWLNSYIPNVLSMDYTKLNEIFNFLAFKWYEGVFMCVVVTALCFDNTYIKWFWYFWFIIFGTNGILREEKEQSYNGAWQQTNRTAWTKSHKSIQTTSKTMSIKNGKSWTNWLKPNERKLFVES